VSKPRSILITGASSGIGWASAAMLKARGWRVFATARTDADRARLERDLGVEALPLELKDMTSIAACADAALERTNGRLDALFNNAAYGQVGAVEDLSADVLRDQLLVNVVGQHELTRRIIPSMRRAGEGRIVQCSSVLGLVASPYRGAYCASKFALEALTDSMRLELKGTGIRVSLIEPGPIRTAFVENALAMFRATIDIEASPHRDLYKARLATMQTGGKQTFKLEPEAVGQKLIHALESPRPKIRYYVTTPTYMAAVMKRLATPAMMDWFQSKT
jgi:NAD(P)-dependent dehydrogenase (short-subunit alcohol dehydrogenase family)